MSARDKGGSTEVVRSDRGITITLDSDAIFTPAGVASNWSTFLRDLCSELKAEQWRLQFSIHESSGDVGWEESIKKALQLKALLVESGAPAEVISGKAFGGTRPIASNETADGQRLNRRIELYLTDETGNAP